MSQPDKMESTSANIAEEQKAKLKDDDSVLYLVRETKGTKNFEKLRNAEAEKIRCGRKHFESLDVDFDVVTSAKEI